MKIAIHQPNYFPWLGYFIKIHQSDVFIFHDNVQLNYRSYTRRCYLKGEQGEKILSLKTDPKEAAKIFHYNIDDAEHQFSNHLYIISSLYRRTKYYDEVFPFVQNLLLKASKIEILSQANAFLIEALCDKLDIKTKFYFSSEANFSSTKDAHNLALVKWKSGQTYLSGTGAKKYQSEEIYKENNIQLVYLDTYKYLTQIEAPIGFNPTLSVLDTLFQFGTAFTKQTINSFN